jgi:uncharacterized protein YggE
MLSRRTLFTLLTVLAIALMAVIPAAAQDMTNAITVTGSGSAKGAPDTVTIEVGVEQFNGDVREAFSAANATLRAVIDGVKAEGVAATDVTTSNLSVFSTSRYNPTGVEERGFSVSNTVRVVLRDTSKIEAVIDAAINAGANQIYGLNFTLSDDAALETEARAAAFESARARAEEIAALIGAELGDVIAVSESSDGYVTPFGRMEAPVASGMGGGGDAYVEPGQSTVTIVLQVAFAIVR